MKGVKISCILRDVSRKNKYLKIDNKAKIYKTIVRLVLTYGAETLRSLTSRMPANRIRSHEIREECGITDVIMFVRKRRQE